MTNEMSVAEAMIKAREYADKDKDLPSVSRTLAAEITQLRGNLSLAEDGLAAAMQEIAGLRAALKKYGGHKEECACLGVTGENLYNDRCDCGLQQILHGSSAEPSSAPSAAGIVPPEASGEASGPVTEGAVPKERRTLRESIDRLRAIPLEPESDADWRTQKSSEPEPMKEPPKPGVRCQVTYRGKQCCKPDGHDGEHIATGASSNMRW